MLLWWLQFLKSENHSLRALYLRCPHWSSRSRCPRCRAGGSGTCPGWGRGPAHCRWARQSSGWMIWTDSRWRGSGRHCSSHCHWSPGRSPPSPVSSPAAGGGRGCSQQTLWWSWMVCRPPTSSYCCCSDSFYHILGERCRNSFSQCCWMC